MGNDVYQVAKRIASTLHNNSVTVFPTLLRHQLSVDKIIYIQTRKSVKTIMNGQNSQTICP